MMGNCDKQSVAEKHALIICTRNRPDGLKSCLKHVFKNSVLPETIIIVDSSDEPAVPSFELIPLQLPVHFSHLISETASIPYQRNLGLSAIETDTQWIHFIDDDFIPEQDYFQELIQTATKTNDAVMLGGIITNNQQKRRAISLYHRFFLLDSAIPGKFLASGATSEPQARDDLPTHNPFEVDWISGCSMSISSELIHDHNISFDETLKGYAQDEDLDFCCHVSAFGNIMVQPKAKGKHKCLSHERSQQRVLKRFIAITHRYYIIRKHGNELNKLLFWWSQFGSLLILVARYNQHKIYLLPTFLAWRTIFNSIVRGKSVLEIPEDLRS